MKKLFGTMAVAAALFAGYSAYEAQNSVNINDVALANVEALAGNSGDEGTPSNICYYQQTWSSTTDWKIFCDSRTNENTIYPCLKPDWGGYNSMQTDRCINQ